MKKITILTAVLVGLLSFSVQAQGNKKRVTGPKAKNAKPWDNKKEYVQVPTLQVKERKMGPQAKNAKPWSNPKSTDMVMVEQKERVTGPKAKNAKPWRQ